LNFISPMRYTSVTGCETAVDKEFMQFTYVNPQTKVLFSL